jgi:hypothetical protein
MLTDGNFVAVPIGEPPQLRPICKGKMWVVIGDPRGPLAHKWENRETRKLYRTERGARALLTRLQRAYERRVAAAR